MSQKTYYQPGTDGAERRSHPEFGISEDRAQLLIRGAIEASLRAHESEIVRQMDSRFAELTDLVRSAFPEGDPLGHRRSHEREIEAAKGWEKLKADMLAKVLTGGVWAAIAWLALITFEAIKQEVKK